VIYIGSFFHLTDQQHPAETDRRHGEFILIVQAQSADAASVLFRQRIEDARASSTLFAGKGSVFFTQLLEMDQLPRTEALMVNYKSIAGDPAMPFIGCSVPMEQVDGCRIVDWDRSRPAIDGKIEPPFLSFDAPS